MKHHFKVFVFLLLWPALSASIRQDRLPISVYWISSPTHVNETLLIAGAGLHQASTKLCRDANCHAVINNYLDIASWKQSLSFVLPDACATPPCYLVLEQNATTDKEIIAVNAPDVWWGLSGEPSAIPTTGFEDVRSVLSNKPYDIHVTIGDNIRVFGRSLAWSSGNPRCIPTANSEPSAVSSTRLVLSPQMAKTTRLTIGNADKNSPGVPALSAACYEATFSSSGMMAGNYPEAVVVTPWGTSQKLNITLVSPRAKPARNMFDVGTDFGGNLSLAIEQANVITTKDPNAAVDLMLGTRTYHLQVPVVLPNRTRLVGSGAGVSTLVFDLAPPAPPHPTRCSAPVLSDFYTADCKQRGCHVKRRCPGCFLQIRVLTSPSTLGECCAACIANAACNAWTFIGDPGGGRGSMCELNSCPDEPSPGHNSTCAATPSFPGPHNRTSGWVLGRTLPKAPPRAAIVIGGRENSLVNFSVRVQSAPALMPAVAMETSASSFVAEGLNITLLQDEVSNAFKLEGVGFELRGNTMNQVSGCNRPNYGPDSDRTPFQPSVTIYMHNARAGLLTGNTILWRCSAYDLDVSDRVIFEDNVVKCTEKGVVPHGNSISGYDYHTHPSSRYWSVARNRYSRPAYHKGTEQNWIQRETITTDGPGAFGMGKIVSMSGTNVTLNWLAWVTTPLVGATLVVLDGPGRGQHRLVTGVGSFNGTVELDAPLDAWVSASNTVAVLASLGSKLIIGNQFNWTEVVQWYGNTLRGVMADNSFHHCNVKAGGNINVGSMGGVGECYHGSSQMFFTEFRGNTLQSSDGISLVDNFNRGEWQCAPYGGPWVAWSAIRNNTLGGISEASRNRSAGGSDSPMCAFVSVQGGGSEANGYTSDVVTEGNVFECPPEGNNSIQYRIRDCRHCSRR